MRASLSCLAVFAATIVGCSADIEPGRSTDLVGRAIQPIIEGVPSSAEHDAVVVLAQFDGATRRGLCTATLVAPNLVLTARHCVSNADTSIACNTDGTALTGAAIHEDVPAANLVVFAGKGGKVASTNDVSLASARGTELIVDGAKTLCNHDLAFVLLDRPVDAPIATLRLSGGPAFSERVTIVGWGITEAGTLPSTRMERTDVAVAGTGPMLMPDNKSFGIGNAEVLFGESACLGDSGGPAFTRSGALVGVASRVGNGKARDASNLALTCTGDATHAVYTHLGQASELVKRAFAAASNLPVVEPDSIAFAPTSARDPQPTDIGRQTQDPDPAPRASTLSAKADVNEDAAAATEDGGCAVSRKPHDATSGAGWLVLLALGALVSREKRAASTPPSRP